jgi:integrase
VDRLQLPGAQLSGEQRLDGEKDALKLLRERLRKVTKPHFVDPAAERRVKLADMLEAIRFEFERSQNRSFHSVRSVFKHLEKAFEFDRVIDITADRIEAYADRRVKEGAARGSVNMELSYLRRGFNLMFAKKKLSEVPLIKLFELNNTRQGFIGVAEFAALLAEVPGEDARDIVEFLYNSAWRSNEAMALRWSWIDLSANMVRLPAEFSKSKKQRFLPLTGALLDVIERRLKKRRLDCEFVFHRHGRQIKGFRRAFDIAATKIGMPDLRPARHEAVGDPEFQEIGTVGDRGDGAKRQP